MFSLEEKLVKITSLNLRKERHGEELVSAADIGVSADLPNSMLAHFHPLLKDSFYSKDDNAQADMIDGESHTPVLKFPGFPAIKWPVALEGYQFIAHTGIGGPSEIRLIDVKIKNVTFLFKDGGTFHIKFSVQAHPSADESGRLSDLIQTEVQITLVPPDEAKQHELARAKKDKKRALDEAFSGGAAGDGQTEPLELDGDADPQGDTEHDEETSADAPVTLE
ncbi:hypothetical protein [Herbaspirillum sp. RV1423]|uniref:hypothetical protein n=1 Tax=Herbaspirillum sp. RV1423 TaxID=1443993 RepID=UPI0004B5D1DA|nr:hypothetical protein [Herbaspirillum sp. RV1423]